MLQVVGYNISFPLLGASKSSSPQVFQYERQPKADRSYRSAWENHHKDADAVGANMADFAFASITYMASRNPLNASPFTGISVI